MPSVPCNSSFYLSQFKYHIKEAIAELADGRCHGNGLRNLEFWTDYRDTRLRIGRDLVVQGIRPPSREFYRLLLDKTAKSLYRGGWWGYNDYESNDGCYTFERHFRLSRHRWVPPTPGVYVPDHLRDLPGFEDGFP